jgi:phosphoglycerate dehydrogenase-like enzyme
VQGFARPFLDLGIKISSAWQANAIPVAEVILAHILLANKGYMNMMYHMKKTNSWREAGRVKQIYPGNGFATVGIVSAGAIGKRVIELIRPFVKKILVFSRSITAEAAAAQGMEKCNTLEELFERSDVISNHMANLPATKGMMNKNHFDRMKDTATFINLGRGAQIVIEDLVAAMKDKPNRMAILDVMDPTEPPPPEHIVFTADNIYLSPHLGGSTGQEPFRHGEWMLEESRLFDAEGRLQYNVTVDMLETMA